jgi:hypothetical protein
MSDQMSLWQRAAAMPETHKSELPCCDGMKRNMRTLRNLFCGQTSSVTILLMINLVIFSSSATRGESNDGAIISDYDSATGLTVKGTLAEYKRGPSAPDRIYLLRVHCGIPMIEFGVGDYGPNSAYKVISPFDTLYNDGRFEIKAENDFLKSFKHTGLKAPDASPDDLKEDYFVLGTIPYSDEGSLVLPVFHLTSGRWYLLSGPDGIILKINLRGKSIIPGRARVLNDQHPAAFISWLPIESGGLVSRFFSDKGITDNSC